MLPLPARPPCPVASACLRAWVSSPGWQTGARLRMRWPSPVGRGDERAGPLLTKTLSSTRAGCRPRANPACAADLASPHQQTLRLSRTSIDYCLGAEPLQVLGSHVGHVPPG